VEQTTENYRIVKDKYDNSLSTTNDLLDADVEQLQAKINQALSKADIAQKYYELQYASGKLINSLNITLN
jgi:outer membrane protein TolC